MRAALPHALARFERNLVPTKVVEHCTDCAAKMLRNFGRRHVLRDVHVAEPSGIVKRLVELLRVRHVRSVAAIT